MRWPRSRWAAFMGFSVLSGLGALCFAEQDSLDTGRCLALKHDGLLLAQQLERSKVCDAVPNEGGELTCSFQVGQTKLVATRLLLGKDPTNVAQIHYTITSLDPKMSLEVTQRKGSFDALLLRWKKEAAPDCSLDWAFITAEKASIASLLLSIQE